MEIIACKGFYTEPDALTDSQRRCYLEIEHHLRNEQYIDVLNNVPYIWLFLHQALKGLLSGADYRRIVKQFEYVKSNYPDPSTQNYCASWFGDLLLFGGEYTRALEAYSNCLAAGRISTLISTRIIELKLHLEINLTAIETVTYKNNITRFGKENLGDVVRYVEAIISKDYELGLLSHRAFLPSGRVTLTSPVLFSGHLHGYAINQLYRAKENALKCVGIGELKGFDSYVLSLIRRAENALREDRDMPRVGEGWISETELFYKIKEHFRGYTVIQHFNAGWLGKQHLDVFIEEMRVGIEYHGPQHFMPVDYFGGEPAFIENQKRDTRKIRKCKRQKVKLIVVTEGYHFDDVVRAIENSSSNKFVEIIS